MRSLKRQAEGLSAPVYSERRHVYGFAISGIEESKVRFWRSRGVQSQQIKCFTYAVAVDLIVQVLSEYVLDGPITALLPLLVAPLVPTAVGIAVLHYRLYDIDILVNRTLVYGSLTAMLVALYLGCVATAQAIFRTLTFE